MTCLLNGDHQREALVLEQVLDLGRGPLKLGFAVDGVPEVLARELDVVLRLQLAVRLGEVDKEPEREKRVSSDLDEGTGRQRKAPT